MKLTLSLLLGLKAFTFLAQPGVSFKLGSAVAPHIPGDDIHSTGYHQRIECPCITANPPAHQFIAPFSSVALEIGATNSGGFSYGNQFGLEFLYYSSRAEYKHEENIYSNFSPYRRFKYAATGKLTSSIIKFNIINQVMRFKKSRFIFGFVNIERMAVGYTTFKGTKEIFDVTKSQIPPQPYQSPTDSIVTYRGADNFEIKIDRPPRMLLNTFSFAQEYEFDIKALPFLAGYRLSYSRELFVPKYDDPQQYLYLIVYLGIKLSN